MVYIIRKDKNETLSLPAIEISPEQAKVLSSPLSRKILESLADKPAYTIQIAKKLQVHEQKVYYHINKLKESGIIKAIKQERIHGALTTFYSLTQPAFYFRFKDFKKMSKLADLKEQHSAFLNPFIKDGELDALVVVGSPDPHGPHRARSRDGYYGIDFALFLGTFLNYVPKLNVRLDTEVSEVELKTNNLIVIGGPIVNKISSEINDGLPIKFDSKSNWAIKSELSNNTYLEEEHGIIIKTRSPYNPSKHLLFIAGKRHSGTRAAILGFLHHFSEITSGNRINPAVIAKVVEGLDMDSDGQIDSVEFKE